jgi:hypothetical protein
MGFYCAVHCARPVFGSMKAKHGKACARAKQWISNQRAIISKRALTPLERVRHSEDSFT